LEIDFLTPINFGKKSRRAKILYKKNWSEKVYAKDSKIEKLEINILTQNFKKKLKKPKS